MADNYIAYIPKPLLNDFVKSRVVPFVGAGFSKNADIPEGLSMPDWNELGKTVADQISDYVYDNNPVEALSYYESLYSRARLVEFLMTALHLGEIKPGKTYEAFCKLFTGTICTTNFDFLLEDTMSLLGRPISTIVTEDRLTVNASNENRILKLHGDFNHPDKMVITEQDYDLYLENNPVFATYVSNLFISNTMLLIGYSLDDNDFRGIWKILNSRLGKMAQPAYCVVVDASQSQIAKYERRNIHVINLPGNRKDYKTILRDFFTELEKYVTEEKDKTAKSRDEKINEQLVIPSSANKLCFISCSMNRVAQLSSLLYPILQTCGVTPVRLDDMIMPGDNWLDVVGTVIRKSKIAIVDISEAASSVYSELAMLQAEKKNVQVICEQDVDIPVTLSKTRILRYTFDYVEMEKSKFSQDLKKWIKGKIEKTNSQEPSEFESAIRLLNLGDYSACIVSAFSEFCGCLSKKYPAMPLRTFQLFQQLKEDGIISSIELKKINEIARARNAIVHNQYRSFTREEVTQYISVLMSILNRLKKRK